uniref:Cytosine-specific methyltransferase n=1 Tax=Psychrobacillus psychrodurans TaxID=126157 RepID=F1CNY4_9BACI|nr:M2.BspACI [Psychrobacillus psychrodurans]
MSFSYTPLWKTMKNKNICSKTELRERVGITTTTLSKLSKNEYVRMDILDKLCSSLDCEISDVITHISDDNIQVSEVFYQENDVGKLKIVSLFSGIGGFEAGLEESNVSGKIVFSSEIDRFAKISYEANFPNHNLHGDITKIDAKDVPNHDLLIGGFPCQAFSIAGSREGFEDIRGTLFFDVARIIREKKPEFLLLENVKNLVSHDNSKTIRVILNTLNELGYTVDFTIINSSEAGVPQSRDRTYIVAIMDYPSEDFYYDYRSKKIDILKSELNIFGFKGFNFFSDLVFDCVKTVIEDVIEDDVEEKYFFNKEIVTDFLDNTSIDFYEPQQKIVKLFDVPREVINDNERQRRVYSLKGLSPTVLARSDSTKIIVKKDGKLKLRKFTPVENLRVQGFSEGFIKKLKSTNVSDTQLYKQSGNAVSPPVITGILNHFNKYFEQVKVTK